MGILVFLIPFAIGIVGTQQAWGQTLCTEPVQPICVDEDLTYQSDIDIKRCRQDVDDFSEEMETFRECLKGKLTHAKNTTENMRARFKCRAEGGTNCEDLPADESASDSN